MYAIPKPYELKFYGFGNQRLLRHMRRFRPVDFPDIEGAVLLQEMRVVSCPTILPMAM